MDCSLPDSSVHGISQGRILEWVAISFSRESSRPKDQTHVSCIDKRFFTTEPSGKPYFQAVLRISTDQWEKENSIFKRWKDLNWHFTKGNTQIAHVLKGLKCFKRWASQVALEVKNTPGNEGGIKDAGLIPGSGRSPGGGHSSPLQYSCSGNPRDRGVWWATVHRLKELEMTEVA